MENQTLRPSVGKDKRGNHFSASLDLCNHMSVLLDRLERAKKRRIALSQQTFSLLFSSIILLYEKASELIINNMIRLVDCAAEVLPMASALYNTTRFISRKIYQ